MTATRLNKNPWREILSNGWLLRHLEDDIGRVELYRDFIGTDNTWNTWGVLYEYKITGEQTYPVTFTSRPNIRVEPYYLGNTICGIEIGTTSNPLTTMPYIYVLRPTNSNPPTKNNDYRVTVFVTGLIA